MRSKTSASNKMYIQHLKPSALFSSESMLPIIKSGYIEQTDLHKPLSELALETNVGMGECNDHPTENQHYKLVAGELKCIGEDLLNEMNKKMQEKFYSDPNRKPTIHQDELWCRGLDGILTWDDDIIDEEIAAMNQRLFNIQHLLRKALEKYLAALLPEGRLTDLPTLREFLRCFFKTLTEWCFFREAKCMQSNIEARSEQFTEVTRRTMYRCLQGRIELATNIPTEQPNGSCATQPDHIHPEMHSSGKKSAPRARPPSWSPVSSRSSVPSYRGVSTPKSTRTQSQVNAKTTQPVDDVRKVQLLSRHTGTDGNADGHKNYPNDSDDSDEFNDNEIFPNDSVSSTGECDSQRSMIDSRISERKGDSQRFGEGEAV